ncbi:MAG: FAD-dependent oxidoreductase [Patescibacteria group bacterium]
MQPYKYLIIGGGAAGTTTAETLRQTDKEGSIAIVSDEPRYYSRIMLSKPNFFLGKIPFDSVWLRQKEWYTENKIDFIEGVLATKLDTKSKSVTLSGGPDASVGTGKILQYEKLLLATGGEARQWPITGADKKGICYVRDLSQVNELIENIKTSKQAIAVGSGFVGFEMCEMMKLAGLEVTMVMREPYFWYPLLDIESAKMIENALEKEGVKILREAEVSEILGNERIEGVIVKGTQPSHEATAGQAKIDCQLAIIGIGLICNLDWIKEAGIETNKGILANEYLETNIPDIYTAGDVAEFTDLILGEKVQLGNWVNAQMQGRTVANNMLGNRKPFKMVSFYTAIGFGLNIAMSGDVRVKPEYKIIKRGSPEINSFARIIVDEKDEIIGATFINRSKDMATINKLIESNFKVSGHESELSDPNFDLKSLSSHPQ